MFNFTMITNDDGKENIDASFISFAKDANRFLENGPVLLVIDNVTEQKQMDSIRELAAVLHWKILVTTRFVPEDRAYSEGRVIDLRELAVPDCEELFYENYLDRWIKEDKDVFWQERERSCAAVREIVEIADRHTKIIMHLGRVGKDNGYKVEDILQMLRDKGYSHEGLRHLSEEDEEGRYRRMHEIVASIYDFDRLGPEEKQVLGYFALLPDSPILEERLIEWMQTDNLSAFELRRIFESMFKRGWLEKGGVALGSDQTQGKGRAFKCHSIVQQGLLLKTENKRAAAEGLIQGLTRFLSVEPYEDIAPSVRYFECIWSVLEHLKDPWTVVRELRKKLTNNGILIASIPNIMHRDIIS